MITTEKETYLITYVPEGELSSRGYFPDRGDKEGWKIEGWAGMFAADIHPRSSYIGDIREAVENELGPIIGLRPVGADIGGQGLYISSTQWEVEQWSYGRR